MKDYKRLTTDMPSTNLETMLNYAYDKNGEVYLRYADGEPDVSLCEYVSKLANARCCEATPSEVMEGKCLHCDCETGILNIIAIQAAELRHRLTELENKLESGELLELPKYGDTYWYIGGGVPEPVVVTSVEVKRDQSVTRVYAYKGNWGGLVGEIMLPTYEQAEARLKEWREEQKKK